MPTNDVQQLSDEDLEDIQRLAKDADIPEKVTEQAEVELDLRRKRELFELQENFIKTLQQRLSKAFRILKYIDDKPTKSVIIAGIIAVLIGVTINVISEFLIVLFGLK